MRIENLADAIEALQSVQTCLEELLTWRELQAKTRESLTKACNHVDLARYDLNQIEEAQK